MESLCITNYFLNENTIKKITMELAEKQEPSVNGKIIGALKGKNYNRPPIWLMRQAGRYLPEYRKIREEYGSFLKMCYTPEIASEITLQPIRRFGFDAAIIFSDILVIPHAMGMGLDYIEGKGPVLESISDEKDIDNLRVDNISGHLQPVFDTIGMVRDELPDETALIGFAGAPWTVATYMIEGGGSKDFAKVKGFTYNKPELFNKIIDIIVKSTISYIGGQIRAGADLVQIFDSWSGVVPEPEFTNFIIEPTRKIVDSLKIEYPDVPIIGFPKGAGVRYVDYARETGVDGVGIDYTVPPEWAAENLQPYVCVQGNLDPFLLASNNRDKIISQTEYIIDKLGKNPFIFNLGHGILPNTPVENVELLLDVIKN